MLVVGGNTATTDRAVAFNLVLFFLLGDDAAVLAQLPEDGVA
jgi:hypothetical protein